LTSHTSLENRFLVCCRILQFRNFLLQSFVLSHILRLLGFCRLLLIEIIFCFMSGILKFALESELYKLFLLLVIVDVAYFDALTSAFGSSISTFLFLVLVGFESRLVSC
jgi:hypothetical protein